MRSQLHELRASLGRMELVLGSIRECIVWVDADGRVRWCNEAFDRLLERPRIELIGQRLEGLLPLVGKSGPLQASELPLTVETTPAGEEREYRFRSARGVRTLSVFVVAYPGDPAGGRILIVRDVTDQDRALELERLFHAASHDLIEPTRAIANLAQLVSARCAGLDRDALDLLSRIDRAARRLVGIVDQLVTLSEIRQFRLSSHPTESARIVAAAIRRHDEVIRRTGARIRVRPDLPVLRVDAAWTTEAVAHLLGNALKFTRPDEVPDVEIDRFEGPEGIGIVVRDRGPGVDPEFADRIFDLFWRAVGRDIEGAGAGLAIVRQVAQRHGGSAFVRPREGGGSEFVFAVDPIFAGPGRTAVDQKP